MPWVVDEIVEDALRELVDPARQRELWLSTGDPEVSSFMECVSRLWDDSGLGTALDRPGTVYTQDVQRCENVSTPAPVDYWDVTYNFGGYEHHVQTTSPPGRTILVNGQGEPRV